MQVHAGHWEASDEGKVHTAYRHGCIELLVQGPDKALFHFVLIDAGQQYQGCEPDSKYREEDEESVAKSAHDGPAAKLPACTAR